VMRIVFLFFQSQEEEGFPRPPENVARGREINIKVLYHIVLCAVPHWHYSGLQCTYYADCINSSGGKGILPPAMQSALYADNTPFFSLVNMAARCPEIPPGHEQERGGTAESVIYVNPRDYQARKNRTQIPTARF
jgi:hypothetical protein